MYITNGRVFEETPNNLIVWLFLDNFSISEQTCDRSNLPLFCISTTLGPIEPGFCVHMECDQANICHNNIKLIWGHLGYANEGQRSNLPLYCISVTLGPIEPRFCVHMECDQANICHNNIKLIWGHLGYANEGQRSNLILFCISGTVGPIEPKFWYVVRVAETILYQTNYIN